MYTTNLCRAKRGLSRRVPGLKYSHVVRDSWIRLNVLPAKIMQVYYNYDTEMINIAAYIVHAATIHAYSNL